MRRSRCLPSSLALDGTERGSRGTRWRISTRFAPSRSWRGASECLPPVRWRNELMDGAARKSERGCGRTEERSCWTGRSTLRRRGLEALLSFLLFLLPFLHRIAVLTSLSRTEMPTSKPRSFPPNLLRQPAALLNPSSAPSPTATTTRPSPNAPALPAPRPPSPP